MTPLPAIGTQSIAISDIVMMLGTCVCIFVALVSLAWLWRKHIHFSNWIAELESQRQGPIQAEFERKWMPADLPVTVGSTFEGDLLIARVISHYRAFWAAMLAIGFLPFILGVVTSLIGRLEYPHDWSSVLPIAVGLFLTGIVSVCIGLQRFTAMRTIHLGIHQLLQKVLARVYATGHDRTNPDGTSEEVTTLKQTIAKLTNELELMGQAKSVSDSRIAELELRLKELKSSTTTEVSVQKPVPMQAAKEPVMIDLPEPFPDLP